MLCQYCLERGLEPNEAIAEYKNIPICDPCLAPIYENANATQVDQIEETDLENRKKRAFEVLDKFEELFDDWYLFENEVLNSRDDFFNHRPPAVINLTNEQIKALNSRRKAVLYAFRIKDEQWTEIIDKIRTEERRKENLVGVTKSIVEKTKKTKGENSLEAKKKLAKAMGITVAQLDAMGSQARQSEFEGIVGAKPEKSKWEKEKRESTSSILSGLQAQVKAQTTETKSPSNPLVSKRCPICNKFSCPHPRG